MPTWINNKPTKQIGYENRTLICTDPSNNFGQFSDDPWTDLSPTITSWGRSCFGNPEVSISHILLRDFTGIFYPLSLYHPEDSISHIAQGMHRDFTGIYYRKVRIENLDSTRSHNSFFVVCSLFGTNIFYPLTNLSNIDSIWHKYLQYLAQISAIISTNISNIWFKYWQYLAQKSLVCSTSSGRWGRPLQYPCWEENVNEGG